MYIGIGIGTQRNRLRLQLWGLTPAGGTSTIHAKPNGLAGRLARRLWCQKGPIQMRIDISAGTCFLAAALGVCVCSQPLGAQAAEDKIKKSVTGRLEDMDNATSPMEIIEARRAMVRDYRFWDGRGEGLAYAQEAASQSVPRLKKYDSVKQINLAMALSRMPQASIQPALDVMVWHGNTAVRYLGWRGYRDARVGILTLGGKPMEAYFAAQKDRAAAEASPVVITTLIETTRVPRALAGRVRAAALKRAQQQALAALESGWAVWCQRVIDQDAPTAAAVADAVAALQGVYEDLGSAPKARKAILQRICEMMFCSSAAYQKSTAEDSDPLAEANAKLLAACEGSLRALSGLDSQRVRQALQERDRPTRKIKAAIAVIKWREDLKLPEPKFKPGGGAHPTTQPTTQPATQPATQPTTQPATKPAKSGPATAPVSAKPAPKGP